jgi:hypothetical protein
MYPEWAWTPRGNMTREQIDALIIERMEKRAEENATQWKKTATPLIQYQIGDRLLIKEKSQKQRKKSLGVAYPYVGRAHEVDAERTRVKVIYDTRGRANEEPKSLSTEWIHYKDIKLGPTYGEQEREGHSEMMGTVFSPPRPPPVTAPPDLTVVPLRTPSEVERISEVLQQTAPHILERILAPYVEKLMDERMAREVPHQSRESYNTDDVTAFAADFTAPYSEIPDQGMVVESDEEPESEEDPTEIAEQVPKPKESELLLKCIVKKALSPDLSQLIC